MSEDAMNKAYWQFAGATLDSAALAAFRAGWRAAMTYMAQPRIPALTLTPTQKGPGVIGERYVQVECPECDGLGVVDSGGFDAMGAPVSIGCRLCRGKPVTEAQVRAAGWVNANEKPQPKEHNPHGLVAFYTDAPDV